MTDRTTTEQEVLDRTVFDQDLRLDLLLETREQSSLSLDFWEAITKGLDERTHRAILQNAKECQYYKAN